MICLIMASRPLSFPDSMASFTVSLDAMTLLLVASSASFPILFEPPIKAPIITQIAIMIMAVLYFTTRVATAVPKVQDLLI